MTTIRIESDSDFKKALADLSVTNQRKVGKLFVDHVMELTDSSKVKQAMASVGTIEPPAQEEIANAYSLAKSAAIESYTLCGNQADWSKQAGHFVAAAAVSCLTPDPQQARGGGLAWSTAMNARMARVCEKIAEGETADDSEAREQYRILETSINRD